MRKIITGIISEASGIATWVYVQKYEKHKLWMKCCKNGKAQASLFIVMDTWFEN